MSKDSDENNQKQKKAKQKTEKSSNNKRRRPKQQEKAVEEAKASDHPVQSNGEQHQDGLLGEDLHSIDYSQLVNSTVITTEDYLPRLVKKRTSLKDSMNHFRESLD